MKILYVSGSPRRDSNTDYLLHRVSDVTGGEFLKLTDYQIAPCKSCWACVSKGACIVKDDMSQQIMPKLLDADAIVVGTPVFFNNVTAQLKAFMDRTWALRGQLTNKIGGTVVVGRRYGAEGAITCINSYFLKHKMIVADRGVSGIAFESGEAAQDTEALQAATRLGDRILDLGEQLGLREI